MILQAPDFEGVVAAQENMIWLIATVSNPVMIELTTQTFALSQSPTLTRIPPILPPPPAGGGNDDDDNDD